LLCDGSGVSTTTYADLFAVIGYTYGGSGSLFALPDLRGRVPTGLDNMGGTDAGRLSATNTLGGTGGAETHTLTSAEIPAHSHPNYLTNTTVASTSHTHTEGTLQAAAGAVNNDSGSYWYNAGVARAGGRGPTTTGSFVLFGMANNSFTGYNINHWTNVFGTTSGPTGSTTVGMVNANNTGGGGSHNNMQPYILTNYIIKF
jgi:microcystin-dependent protein